MVLVQHETRLVPETRATNTIETRLTTPSVATPSNDPQQFTVPQTAGDLMQIRVNDEGRAGSQRNNTTLEWDTI